MFQSKPFLAALGSHLASFDGKAIEWGDKFGGKEPIGAMAIAVTAVSLTHVTLDISINHCNLS